MFLQIDPGHRSRLIAPRLLIVFRRTQRAGLFLAGAGALSFAKVMLDEEKDKELRAEMAARRERRRQAADAAAVTSTPAHTEA
jgi:hypothetical protein